MKEYLIVYRDRNGHYIIERDDDRKNASRRVMELAVAAKEDDLVNIRAYEAKRMVLGLEFTDAGM